MSHVVAQLVHLNHVRCLEEKVRQNEMALRTEYDKYLERERKDDRWHEKGEYYSIILRSFYKYTTFTERVVSSDDIDNYVSECRRVLDEYRSDHNFIARFNIVEGNIDDLFPTRYYKNVRMVLQGNLRMFDGFGKDPTGRNYPAYVCAIRGGHLGACGFRLPELRLPTYSNNIVFVCTDILSWFEVWHGMYANEEWRKILGSDKVFDEMLDTMNNTRRPF